LLDTRRIEPKFTGMSERKSRLRFLDRSGHLKVVEISRSNARPLVSTLHQALFALGVVVTSYQVQATSSGLQERLELSSADGAELDAELSERARAAIVPLALSGE